MSTHPQGKKNSGTIWLLPIFLLMFPASYGAAQTITLSSLEAGAEAASVREGTERFFPALYFTETLETVKTRNAGRPYWVDSEDDYRQKIQNARNNFSLLLNNDILAFYGHPLSRNMGILGRYSIQELDARLTELAAAYAAENGGRGVKKAFYIIYGTVWPEGEIGILKDD
ncbi:MAG: hypothetical protein LBG10_08970, partial [Treponema sp.]|nr:hypothetical protein [Treponema sp.]